MFSIKVIKLEVLYSHVYPCKTYKLLGAVVHLYHKGSLKPEIL